MAATHRGGRAAAAAAEAAARPQMSPPRLSPAPFGPSRPPFSAIRVPAHKNSAAPNGRIPAPACVDSTGERRVQRDAPVSGPNTTATPTVRTTTATPARRLTSDMISFRATVIPADGMDVALLDANGAPNSSGSDDPAGRRPLAKTFTHQDEKQRRQQHKQQQQQQHSQRRPDRRRHTVAGGSPPPGPRGSSALRRSDLPQRFSAIKIESVPPSSSQSAAVATKRASNYMYSRASSFTFGSGSGGASVVAGYSFIPDQTLPPDPAPSSSSSSSSSSSPTNNAAHLMTRPRVSTVPSACGAYMGNGKTVYAAFAQTARRHEDAPALFVLPPTSNNPAAAPTASVTWRQLHARVLQVARVLARLGFSSGEGLVICAASSPAMYALHLAALALGGVVAHVRASWRAVDLADHILPAARARVLVVDRLADNFIDAIDRRSRLHGGDDGLSSLFRAVVVLGPDQDPVDLLLRVNAPVNVLTMDDVYALATDDESAGESDMTPSTRAVEEMAARVSPAQCCALEFGLDARGAIRGVRLSHDNVLFTAATLAQSFGPLSSADRTLGYLPLHHIASQVLEIFMPIVCGLAVTCVAFSESCKSLKQVIAASKPSVLFATPATWANVSAQVYRAKREVNGLLYRWAKTRATNNSKKQLIVSQQQQQSQPQKKQRSRTAPRSLGYILAKKLVLNAIKRKIGLESCAACYSVLAPLDFELERLFQTVDLPIYQLDGTAETSGFAALNFPNAWEFGSSGRALRGTVLRCDELTQDVLLRGRNVFMGYVRSDPSQNSRGGDEDRVVDGDDGRISHDRDQSDSDGSDEGVRVEPHVPSNGWFTLYQRGFLTPNGFLKLHDPRDFVVLSTGDWVPIRPLERAITDSHPELERAVLVGDGRAFLSVLLFLQTTGSSASPSLSSPSPSMLSTTGNVNNSNRGGGNRPQPPPQHAGQAGRLQLGEDALQVARRIGSTATTVPDAFKCQAWAVHFDELLETLPARSAVAAAGFRVRKWMIMASAFTVETGELDPDSGDVKRRVVERKYQALLDILYS